MSESLYSIASNMTELIEKGIVFDEDTGEVFFDESDMEGLAESLEKKLEAVQVVSTQKRQRAEFLESEAKRFRNAASALRKSAQSLDEYAVKCVKPLGRVETDHFSIGTRTSEAVQVLDEGKVPQKYLREKKSYSVDKVAVKAALKAGDSVPGCALIKNVNIAVK